MSFFVEVPCRLELQYPVLQTGASPLGQGTLAGAKVVHFIYPAKFFPCFLKFRSCNLRKGSQSTYPLDSWQRLRKWWFLCTSSSRFANIQMSCGILDKSFAYFFNFMIQKNRLPLRQPINLFSDCYYSSEIAPTGHAPAQVPQDTHSLALIT